VINLLNRVKDLIFKAAEAEMEARGYEVK